jgi:hypothetical protein
MENDYVEDVVRREDVLGCNRREGTAVPSLQSGSALIAVMQTA